MARNGRYRVPFKRRRKGLTNYYKRKKMILSGKPRLIVRKSNKHVIVQVATAKIQGDEIITSASSIELEKKFGWKGATRNTPVAYLVGLLAGLKALKRGVKEAILDIGLHRPIRGAIVFAAAKGALDAGLKIPIGEEVLPEEERIRGEHIANYAKILLEEDLEKYNKQFSRYLSRGWDPTLLPKYFEEVKSKILELKSELSHPSN
ncbi:MAG: 50S ribosomal protein L18 [Thermoprotei archaeon]|nr:MAG: 50S ribosomal protein L18 [Thermofilum sp. ex4484_79]RLE60810.1 MAG: 50S ribosomal protein L18 [Thermoprotei archaeon]